MGSGPRAGIGELLLPELQKGSSIMPGKVNPVIPEVVIQVSAQVIGNDAAVTIGGMQGQFELNVRVPLIARNLLESIRLLSSTARVFAEKCVDGIEANEEGCRRSAEMTLAAATALNPYIGYDKGDGDRQGGRALRSSAARGGARAGRRRGHLRSGDGPAQDGAGEPVTAAGPAPGAGYLPLAANAFASEETIEIRFPSAMFASNRCRPHSGVGLGVGVFAPTTALISSTLASFAEEQCAR